MTGAVPAGLYVLTGGGSRTEGGLLEGVAAAIRGGARWVQYRDKDAPPDTRATRARVLRRLCSERGVPLIVNDDVALAQAVDAAGVHLGRDDAPLQATREALGAGALIGISCYDSLDRARAAEAGGADYVAFGRFFPSRTKPRATPAPIALLRRARAALSVPIVAIGGITPENGVALIVAGADVLAVGHGVFGHADVEAAARRYAALFDVPTP